MSVFSFINKEINVILQINLFWSNSHNLWSFILQRFISSIASFLIIWLWLNAFKKYLAAAKFNLTRRLNYSSLLILFYSVLRYCSTYNLKIYFLVLQVKHHTSYKFENLLIYLTWPFSTFATILHINNVLAYFFKQHSIYPENCSKNFLSDFGKTFAPNRGNLPSFTSGLKLLWHFHMLC